MTLTTSFLRLVSMFMITLFNVNYRSCGVAFPFFAECKNDWSVVLGIGVGLVDVHHLEGVTL